MTSTSRRQFLSTAIAAGVTTAISASTSWASRANEEIGLGYISCGNRAKKLMDQFDNVAGVNVTGVCDVDEERLGVAMKRYPSAKASKDMRHLIDRDDIDAVVISTCNHWHCLAAIWALEAGKDVYLEKPLAHNQWEGLQTIAATRKYNRICQIGTQQRSDPMQAEIKKFLHEEKALGEIQSANVNHYFVRAPIGRRDSPLSIGKNVSYDLWLGPAQDQPIFRDNLHYDWHWDWNTGSGDMGNWGVHILDDLRNNVFRDSVSLPKRVQAGGGRVVFNDVGNTPNVHFAYLDTGSIPVLIGMTNLPAKPGSKDPAKHSGPRSGYVAHCQGGRFEGQRGRGIAYDADGTVIKEFKGNRGDILHQQNFIDAVRSRDRSIQMAEVQVGHDSTGWCNLANIAYRVGGAFNQGTVNEKKIEGWRELVSSFGGLLNGFGLDLNNDAIRLSSVLEFDSETERFVGNHADAANRFLKREYRKGFEVPTLT